MKTHPVIDEVKEPEGGVPVLLKETLKYCKQVIMAIHSVRSYNSTSKLWRPNQMIVS